MRTQPLVAALAAVLAVTSQAAAQEKEKQERVRLVGTVVDSATRAPVPTAVVRIEAIRRAAITDSAGHFVIEGVPAGMTYIEVARIGYAPEYLDVKVTAGEPLTVAMQAEPIVLERITVLADRLRARRDRLPTTVRAFGPKQLATSFLDLKQFLSTNGAPLVTCPPRLAGVGPDNNCVIARGEYRQLRVYLNEMPFWGATLELYYPSEFELIEYYPSQAMVRLYTTQFLELVAKGKRHIDLVL